MNNLFDILNKKSKSFFIIAHILVWAMLFFFPYLLVSGHFSGGFLIQTLIKHLWTPLVCYAIVFYANYLWLIDKFLFTKKSKLYLICNVIVVFLMILANQWIKSFLFPDLDQQRPHHENMPPRTFFWYIDSLSMMIPLIFSIGLKIAERWIQSEVSHREATNQKLESEIQHLKYQLQPHFFFNSLNTIYSLVDISPEQAKETIHNLSKLMRYLLYETNVEKVSLAKEIEFMEKYIELMKLRTSAKTKVSCWFPEVKTDIYIAPLLFISLVENAFKHGVSATSPSEIVIKMSLNATQLCFETQNKNLPKSNSDLSNSGIGLENLQKRMTLLYPHQHSFFTQIVEDKFVASLIIQLI